MPAEHGFLPSPVTGALAMNAALARASLAAAAVTYLSGCVYALHPYDTPGQEKLHLVSLRSGQYAVQIADQDEVPVPADGRVIVDVPALPRGCSTYVFGFIKIGDGSPERVHAIHVLRDGEVVRRLSLQDIHGLPLSADGYRVVKP